EFSSHAYQVLWNISGMMRSSPSLSAFTDRSDISLTLTYHCGFSRGSITSLDRLERMVGITIGLSFVPLYNPFSLSASNTAVLASNLFIPCRDVIVVSLAAFNFSATFPVFLLITLCHLPVPNSLSTNVSNTIGILRPSSNGCCTNFPWRCAYLGSSGWTATAVSPSIVSIRVVATTISSSGQTKKAKQL
ncbi:hypothetical protein EGW08_020921, partial [Elysia chlorotica]